MKLTDDQIVEIYLSSDPTAKLAADYGVSTFTIRSVKKGRTRGDITGQYLMFPVQPRSHRKILTDDMVKEIYEFTGTLAQLNAIYGISKSVANNIKFGRTYASVTAQLGPPGELRLHSLTWDDVCTIRASTMETKLLASLFNVSESTVRNIRAGRTRQFK